MSQPTITAVTLRQLIDAGPPALVGPDHPVLRTPARALSNEELSAERDLVAELVWRLWQLLDAIPHGIGLAAPQVGWPLALFVADDGERRVTALNPQRLGLPSLDKITMDEGCLSLPKLNGVVSRPARQRVRMRSLDGTLEVEVRGTLSRIFDHELDHLAGRLFIDRVVSGSLSELGVRPAPLR